ncbi:hypothetical protein BDV28DRAFT_143405, partial [Aspergillus coremiiformis]
MDDQSASLNLFMLRVSLFFSSVPVGARVSQGGVGFWARIRMLCSLPMVHASDLLP